jgi:hypothetical protein
MSENDRIVAHVPNPLDFNGHLFFGTNGGSEMNRLCQG